MPAHLPNAPEATRQLSARAEGEGFDTEVARFFGADVVNEDEVPTLIESAELGKSARARAQERASRPAPNVRIR